MARQIALLGGVNVGGAGRLPMAEFRGLLADLGLAGVRTYIQSGNAVFETALSAPALEVLIRDAVAARFGFAPETFVRSPEEIHEALVGHPFAAADPKTVQICFLRETPAPDEAALRALAGPGEDWQVGPRRLALHTPGGYGTSRLAARLPKLLPAPMTARNLRTVAALSALAAG